MSTFFPLSSPDEQFLETNELRIILGADILDPLPDRREHIHIVLDGIMEPSQVICGGVNPLQLIEDAPRLLTGVYFIGHRSWCGIVFLILSRKKAQSLVEVTTLEDSTIKDVRLKGFQKGESPADADPERVNARLEAFEVSTLEDADEGLLAARFEFVDLHAGFLVGFQIVGGKLEAVDAGDDLIIDASIGGFQVIIHRSQPALGEANELLNPCSIHFSLTKHGVGVGFPDEWARPTNDDFLKQIEESKNPIAPSRVTAGHHEVSVKIANPAGLEITSVSACNQRELVVEIEEVVVNWGSRQQDHLLAPTVPAPPAIGSQQLFDIRVALGSPVAEVMGLVDQDDVRVPAGCGIEFLPSQFLLREHGSRNRRVA